MQRKEFLRTTSFTGIGSILTASVLGKVIKASPLPFQDLDPKTLQRFASIKQSAENGDLELFITDFIEDIGILKDLFENTSFKIKNITLLENTSRTIRFQGDSKTFLFDAHTLNVFRNDKVLIEGLVSIEYNSLRATVICKCVKDYNKLSSISGMAHILKPLDAIKVSDIVYIFSTDASKSIESRRFPEYNGKLMNIKPGLNLAGFVNFQTSGSVLSGVYNAIQPVIGSGPFLMSWNINEGLNTDFQLQLPNDIVLAERFKLKSPKVVIKPVNPVYVSLDGILNLKLPGINVSTLGGFTFSPTSITGKFNLDSIADNIPTPFGYPGIHLSSLTATAAVMATGATLGAEGSFYIGDNKPSNTSTTDFQGMKSNQYKFVFDAVPGKVDPKFCYLYLEKLTLQDYLRAISGANITLPSVFNKISLQQVMFHWSEIPEGVQKPDGTIGYPIFGFSGIADIFGHKTFAELVVDRNNDSHGKLIAAPIRLANLVSITGEGKPPTGYKGSTKVDPGGCEFEFSAQGLKFSAAVEVLGLKGGASGEITDNGISARLRSQLGGIIKDHLDLTVNNKDFHAETFIEAKVSAKVSLGTLGTVKLDTVLQGDFEGDYSAGEYSNSMHFVFDFAGVHFDLGRLTTEVKVTDLTKLPQQLEEIIAKAIKKLLTEDVIKWLIAALNNGLEFVGDKLEQIGKSLKDVFNQSIDLAAQSMKQANYVVKDVGEALKKGYNASSAEVARALKNAGYGVTEIAGALKEVYGLLAKETAKLLKELGYTVTDVGKSLASVYQLTDKVATSVLKEVGYTATQIGNVLSGVYNKSNQATAALLKEAGFGATEIGTVLKDIYGETGKAATDILKQVGFVKDDCGKVLTDVYGESSKAVKSILGGLFGKKKKCILSTAAVEYKGHSDDCHELTVLRRFRDTYMLNLPNGSQIIEDYYTLSAQIIEKVSLEDDNSLFYDKLYTHLVMPSVALIERQLHEKAYHYYRNFVQDLHKEIIGKTTSVNSAN